MKKITVMGGGTGTFVVLSGLKQHDVDLGVIVNMMDSGGSTGRLRVQLGVLPPGDIRQCFVALSEAPDLWRRLFLYRFDSGDFEGHNFGNIFLSALEKVSKNYDEVLETASFVLKTKGKVLPVTHEKTHLCVEYANGTIVKGEADIDSDLHEQISIKRAFLEPKVIAYPQTIQQIAESDMIVIGPGDLYTSIIPLFLVDGVSEALKNTKAKIVYVINLMTKSGQTNNYTAKDHVRDIEQYLGRKVDAIIMHKGELNESIVNWYETHNEHTVVDDLGEDGRVVRANIADNTPVAQNSADKISSHARSILRHESSRLAKAVVELL
ncbi:MAG: gluconeogenesis factor YvcK family protein [Microgenomates group bacterium]